jgi:esterase/lipase superfamily enzyme
MLESRAMGRKVHLWRFGSFGVPVLVFPSASGMAHEWDAQGMVGALEGLINAGRIKLYCTETNVAEAWTRQEGDPGWRLWRHHLFEQYVVDELVPYIRDDCRTPDIRLAATGTSLGAFYSANFTLKNPSIFKWALCMSGRYDMSSFLDGYQGPGAFENNPIAYVPHMQGDLLSAARQETHLTLVVGQGQWEDGNVEESQRLASLLEEKGIRVKFDPWGHDVSHEWEWWRRQALHHIGGTL